MRPGRRPFGHAHRIASRFLVRTQCQQAALFGIRKHVVERPETVKALVKAGLASFDSLFDQRQHEADEFYDDLQSWAAEDATPMPAFNEHEDSPADHSVLGKLGDLRHIQRQAYAGLLWSKQFYHFDVGIWQDGDPAQPPPPKERIRGRNHEWRHFNSQDIISMLC